MEIETLTNRSYIKIKEAIRIIILAATAYGLNLTPLKLQILLYYLQAWHATYFDKHPLYDNNDLPEAWVSGPMYRKVYDLYNAHGHTPIVDSVLTNAENAQEELRIFLNTLELDSDQQELVKNVLAAYLPMSVEKLIFLTHSEIPWRSIRAKYEAFANCTERISSESMSEYYQKRLNILSL